MLGRRLAPNLPESRATARRRTWQTCEVAYGGRVGSTTGILSGLGGLESGGGEVARDLLAVDWEATPLGAPDAWPSSLQTMVRVILTSRFSMWMAWGPELTFFCNDAYRRDTLGKKYPWALGKPASAVWEEIWPEIGPRIETVIATGRATWDEDLLLFLERSGYQEETYHTFSYSALPDENGRTAGMLCVVSESTRRVITDRRMGTLRDLGEVPAGGGDELQFIDAACRQLRLNPRSIPFALVYLTDADGNATLAGTSGIAPGHPAAPERIPADAAAPPWPLDAAARGMTTVVERIDERWPTLPTGAWPLPPHTGLVVPILAPGDEAPYGFLVIGVNRYRPVDLDIRVFGTLIAQRLASGLTAARSYLAERRRAEELAELDRAKTLFFSNVSHELRTPLTLMLGPLQDTLQDGGPLERQNVELVHRNGLRLLKLVNALLDFAKLEAGRMRAEFRPLDLADFTAQLAGTFREAATRAGIELVVDCPPLPERAYVDPDLWERIVLNLLSNAFKVTLQGSIQVRLRSVGGEVELSVIDTGPGIPKAELGLLFQRFHRVRGATSRSHEGTGIGLALVKELAELHGGAVSARSTVGEGSTFTVRLPAGRAHLPPDQVREDVEADRSPLIASLFVEEALSWVSGGTLVEADASASASADGLAPGSSRRLDVSRFRVLVADDNADLRGYLSRLLAPYWHVEAVADGAAALASIEQEPPDLLIIDVMMPGLDGFELLAAIRNSPAIRELPVIMLSARTGEEASIEGLEAGADDYLPKPFSARELLARVRAHLELSVVRRQAADEVRSERFRLEQTLQQLPVGAMLIDADSGKVVLVNHEVEAILGRSITEVSLTPDERWRTLEGDRLDAERRPLNRVLRAAEVIDEEDFLYEHPDGPMITVRVSAGPISDAAGRTFAVVIVIQDVTDRVHTARLLAGQRDVLALIAAGAPLADTLDAIGELGERLSEPGTDVAIRLDGGDDRAGGEAARPIGERRAAKEAGAADETDADGDSRDAGTRSSTPILAADGQLIGTFTVHGPQSRLRSGRDRRVAELLSRTAAVAIDRAREAQAGARRLAELQSSLLPRALPAVPGLEAAVTFRPGDRALEVGGDFYDLFPLPGGSWGLVVGDVRGHGAEAAAVTALVRHTTRAIGRMERAPAEVLAFVSDALRDSGYDRFCTAVYGQIEPAQELVRIRLACGGHPPPLIRRVCGAVEPVTVHGPLLGVFDAPVFPESVVELRPGDALVLYTDGLVERNPRLADEAALGRLVGGLGSGPADALLRGLLDAVLGAEPRRLADDVAVLVLRMTPA